MNNKEKRHRHIIFFLFTYNFKTAEVNNDEKKKLELLVNPFTASLRLTSKLSAHLMCRNKSAESADGAEVKCLGDAEVLEILVMMKG